MRPGASRFARLESLRGFAALYVCFDHFAVSRLAGSPWSYLLRFGSEAVMLFFLLSGFVVYYATVQKPDGTFRAYFIKRARRIFPLFLLSLPLAYAVACYVVGGWAPLRGGVLLGNVLMLQDLAFDKPGVWFDAYGNPALWSLSYEWWFYMLFYLVHTAVRPPEVQKYAALGISTLGLVGYLAYPNQLCLYLMYFVIWWAGVEMAREYCEHGTVTWRGQRPMIAALAFTAVAWTSLFLRRNPGPLRFGVHPILELRHIASALVFMVGGIVWHRYKFRGFDVFPGPFVVLAPVSYALYVFHYPMLTLSSALPTAGSKLLSLALFLGSALLLAYVGERRLQPWINRQTERLLARPRPVEIEPT